MDKKTKQTGFRLLPSQKTQMEMLVAQGKFKSLSDILRAALEEFLNREA